MSRIRFPAALLAITTLLAPVLAAQEKGGGDRISGRPFASRSPVLAREAMVATSQPLATQAALEVLRDGGTAVDAAIAANAVLGLVEPTGCGIGGDLFAIVWDGKAKAIHGLNASGRSPLGLDLAGLKKALGDRSALPAHGALPVTVPGCVDGWFALHGRFGHLPMRRLLAPAIRYARSGFPVSQLIAHYWDLNARSFLRSPELAGEEGFARTFLIEGRAPRAGEVFRNPDLAESYELLAEEGRDAFYRGAIARAIETSVARLGGALSRADLAAHASEWVRPLSTDYRGHRVWQLPPNTQGLAVLQMLDLLERHDVAALERNGPEHLHLLIELKKIVYEDRARHYADPAFAKLPIERLLAPGYAEERARLFDPERAAARVAAGRPELEEGDTVYLCTADRWGNMVSLIQSNYRGMGSGVVPDGCGFVLQDRGQLFALDPGHANVYAPGKRPFHTIIPGFVTREGEGWLAFGVMGGAMQPQGQVQVLSNLVDFGLNVQEAGDAARFNHSGSSQPTGEVMSDGGRASFERGIPAAVLEELRRRGHRVGRGGSFGGYQAILRDPETGVYQGASEMRKDGQAAGF